MLKAALAALSFATLPAGAIVLAPTVNAASALGFEVAGEVEFAPRSALPPGMQMVEVANTIRDYCPRTQNSRFPSSKPAHVVVMAWADREFPAEREELDATALALAEQRANNVAARLKREFSAGASFDLVNMATKKPFRVRLGERAQVHGPDYDVKTAMKIAGAAPSSRLELGLFAEYAQRSKAVVWVDCYESFGPRPQAMRGTYSLAQLWGTATPAWGNLERECPAGSREAIYSRWFRPGTCSFKLARRDFT